MPSTRYPPSKYVKITESGEPETFSDAMTHMDKNQWLKAMHEEKNSLHENPTYELVALSNERKVLKTTKVQGKVGCKGFGQKKGIDFDENFSLVTKMSSIRTILSLITSLNLKIEQLDVKTAFLHGDLYGTIYFKQSKDLKSRERRSSCAG